jgi:putative membrane protein
MGSVFNDTAKYLQKNRSCVLVFFIVFYFVGFFGLIIPHSQPYFLKLFPFALIISFAVILFFHQDTFDAKTILILIITGVAGYLVEVAGVNSHLIFGSYSYGKTLGLKIAGVPLLIGINWVMLAYTGSAITEKMNLPVYLKIIIAALLMLLYDIFLEQKASALDMWHWKNGLIPLRNYLAWFITGLVFQTLIKITRTKISNSIAAEMMMIQVIFFIFLIIFF